MSSMQAKARTNGPSPVFLLKTYNLIEASDKSIISWTSNGTAFVVKQPKVFASEILPKYFKHNNFSSFVRQLNFYGFKKQRRDADEKTNTCEFNNWWEFRHESFARGGQHLLSGIRRKAPTEMTNIDKNEVEELRKEISSLQQHVCSLNQQMQGMMNQLSQIMYATNHPSQKQQVLQPIDYANLTEPPAKRQRVQDPAPKQQQIFAPSLLNTSSSLSYDSTSVWAPESFYSIDDSSVELGFPYSLSGIPTSVGPC